MWVKMKAQHLWKVAETVVMKVQQSPLARLTAVIEIARDEKKFVS